MDNTPQESIRTKVIARYSQVALTAGNRSKYPVGSESLRRLNYPARIIDELPDETKQFYCGVGNVFSVGTVHVGESVLDIGCGAGVDCLVAASLVGPSGSIVGIDITEAMLDRARTNLSTTPLSNVRFMLARGEEIPLPDCSVDVVISNGAINLSPDKTLVLVQIPRILRPGGRLMMADMFLEEGISQQTVATLDAWSD